MWNIRKFNTATVSVIHCDPKMTVFTFWRNVEMTKWPISSVWSQYEHTGECSIFISNNFMLQFMILLIILYWNGCNFVSRKQITGLKNTSVHYSSDISKSTCNVVISIHTWGHIFHLHMGQVTKMRLPCYLVLLSLITKPSNKTAAPSWPDPHTIHKLILRCIYLTVKLYRCDECKVPSHACMSTLAISPMATLVAGFVSFVKAVESDF